MFFIVATSLGLNHYMIVHVFCAKARSYEPPS